MCGRWAQHVSCTLTARGVRCAVLDDWAEFHQQMLVKLLWSSIFWLLSAGLGAKPVRAGASQQGASQEGRIGGQQQGQQQQRQQA